MHLSSPNRVAFLASALAMGGLSGATAQERTPDAIPLQNVPGAGPSQTEPAAPTENPHQQDSAATQPLVVPPVLVHFHPASAPVDLEAPATVVLLLTVGTDGAVHQAEPREGTPELFEPARLASRQLRFRPATRDGQPVAARILFSYEFEPPKRVPPQSSTSAPKVEQGPSASPRTRSLSEESVAVTVVGRNESERLRRSAQAVRVVDTSEAKQQTADLGEVLARTDGVAVRRSGGLGSDVRISLGGFGEDRTRVFIDGLPLQYAGYPFGLGNVPVAFVQRIEVYRGVVPIRFGADALGGAINLVSNEPVPGTGARLSYQTGSFNTHRGTASVSHLSEAGLLLRGSAFADYTDNDYDIEVTTPDQRGRPQRVEIPRFHDRYRAVGGSVEVGVVERPRAERAVLRLFATSNDDELQHDVVMVQPYGEVTQGRTTYGATLHHSHRLGAAFRFNVASGASRDRRFFRDLADCNYDWLGKCRPSRSGGEAGDRPSDRYMVDLALFNRTDAQWLLGGSHTLRLSAAPTYVRRQGAERRPRNPDAPDALAKPRRLATFVAGAEYELSVLDERVENVLFGKLYLQRADARRELHGNLTRETRSSRDLGWGNALRLVLTDWLWIKASYEYAIRLPTADEAFGDGQVVEANLKLAPERSHNGNLSLVLDYRHPRTGGWTLEVAPFVRRAEDLIRRVCITLTCTHVNLFAARARGVQGNARWSAPGERVVLDANATFQDFRNLSDQGAFAEYEGDRITNEPFLFVNASARLNLPDLLFRRDRLSVFGSMRFVDEFFRIWESTPRAKKLADSVAARGFGRAHAPPAVGRPQRKRHAGGAEPDRRAGVRLLWCSAAWSRGLPQGRRGTVTAAGS